VLPRAAKRWLVFAIVWGSILLVAYSPVLAVFANNRNRTIDQYNTVVTDFNHQKTAVDRANSALQSCPTVSCLRASHLAVAASLDNFDSDLTAMNLPSGAQNAAKVLENDLTRLASVFTDLADSQDTQAYQSTVQRSNLNSLLRSLPNDTNSLLHALNNSIS
jgi:hypothetical protein